VDVARGGVAALLIWFRDFVPGAVGARSVARAEATPPAPSLKNATVALQIDAGYVAAPETCGGHSHAYVTGHNPHQALHQHAFLASVGIGPDTPVTVLSDGGEDISHACQLPAASERVLDWFHIGMRFEHLLNAVRGLRGMNRIEALPQAAGRGGEVVATVARPARAIPPTSGGSAPQHRRGWRPQSPGTVDPIPERVYRVAD